MRQKFLRLLYEHPLWSLGTLLFLGMVLIFGNTFYAAQRIHQDMAQQYAALYITSLKKIRSFYSSQVVSRVQPHGIQVTHDYTKHEKAIPLPATFSIELAQEISEGRDGIKTRLYSDHPFPWRKDGGPHDEYEIEALVRLRLGKTADVPYVRFENVDGRWSLRYASAVVMEEPCIGCHNTHPDSQKRDWQVGDVRGVQELIIPMDATTQLLHKGGLQALAFMIMIVLAGLGILALVTHALRTSIHALSNMNQALQRFVPHEFLRFLQKESIVEVQLADNVQGEMTILFSDIRAFTTLSERMTPEENFRFINAYLSHMGPIVREYHGFIDKYIGDAIMALFACADDAVDASLAMLHRLAEYNQTQHHTSQPPIRIGIGLNTGKLMLGIIGEEHRMEGTVISDAVNLASRVEGMTKMYGASLLISEHTFRRLSDPDRYLIRLIDRVAVKGKAEPVTVYEILNGEPKDVIEKKLSLRKDFDYAVRLYRVKKFEEAKNLFESCLLQYPEDKATEIYIARCEHDLQYGCDENWDGVMHLESK